MQKLTKDEKVEIATNEAAVVAELKALEKEKKTSQPTGVGGRTMPLAEVEEVPVSSESLIHAWIDAAHASAPAGESVHWTTHLKSRIADLLVSLGL